jgi:hypothetical protein
MDDQLDLTFQGGAPQRRIWPVRELMSALRTALEREFPDVWVEGEISNYRPAESGHHYFTLKDGEAQLRATCNSRSNTWNRRAWARCKSPSNSSRQSSPPRGCSTTRASSHCRSCRGASGS